MNEESKFPNLANILGSYFYQCYQDYEVGSPEEIFNNALEMEDIDSLIDLKKDIDSLLCFISAESRIKNLMSYDLGCNYDPEQDGITYVEWIVVLKKLVCMHINHERNDESK